MTYQINDLLKIMEALRNRESGCPWDVEQTYKSIAPYTIEEAYEVADSINNEDFDGLRNELGDLLFQVVFYSQIAKEDSRFDFNDVVSSISSKMIHRHPHVFEDETRQSSQEQTIAWENIKAKERKNQEKGGSALDGVALALPALVRAQKLQKRAARVGFDWPDPTPIFEKIEEETKELKMAIANEDAKNIEEEIGDLLFVCVNLARKLGFDAEESLKSANSKFERRFRQMEDIASQDNESKGFSSRTLSEQEQLWQDVKKIEKTKLIQKS